jgi:serine/threonine protein kinase
MTVSQVTSSDQFVELLATSGLLPAALLDKIATQVAAQVAARVTQRAGDESAGPEISAKDIATELVRQNVLTRYQAERLLSGRARGFFIDRYKVRDILGFGGMGRIYTAEDQQTGRVVALKVLTERHEVDQGMLTRLKLEAEAGARLDHPNVVRTFEHGDTGAVFYMVMEFVRGISLYEVVRVFGALPWRQACDVIGQAAAGLHHAHTRGLVHRDVKPANLLVDAEGNAKVLDFGLALIADEDDAEFSLQMIFGHDCLGTADFIAPEQSLDSRAVDARADVYSLGCTLYFALCGHAPFPEGTTKQKLNAQRTQKPRSIRELVPTVPPEVEAVLGRMLAKSPDDRFATAEEAGAALRALGRRAPIPIDFDRILAARARIARKRAAEHRHARGDSSSSGSSTGSSPDSSSSSVTGGPLTGSALNGSSASGSALLDRAGSTKQMQEDFETAVSPKPSDTSPGVPRQQPGRDAGPSVPPYADAHLSDDMTMTMWAAAERSNSAPTTAFLKPLGGGLPIRLAERTVRLGRDPSCEIVLDRQGVSGKHCEFAFEGSWWKVTDSGSKNGVQVNGQDVKSRMLIRGDVISIAKLYHFRIDDREEDPRPRSRKLRLIAAATVIAALAALAWWLMH